MSRIDLACEFDVSARHRRRVHGNADDNAARRKLRSALRASVFDSLLSCHDPRIVSGEKAELRKKQQRRASSK